MGPSFLINVHSTDGIEDKEKQQEITNIVEKTLSDFVEECTFDLNEAKDYIPLEIVFVCGPNNSGKSTFILQNYGDDYYDLIDIMNFQDPMAYPLYMNDLRKTMLSIGLQVEYVVKRIKDYHNQCTKALYRHDMTSYPKSNRIIIEGTYLKKTRRDFLMESIRPLLKDKDTITCIWLENKDYNSGAKNNFMYRTANYVAERPTDEENYDTLRIIEQDWVKVPKDISERVKDRNRKDIVTENDLLERKSDYFMLNGDDISVDGKAYSHEKQAKHRQYAYDHLAEKKERPIFLLNRVQDDFDSDSEVSQQNKKYHRMEKKEEAVFPDLTTIDLDWFEDDSSMM